jgi:hypothetical protein
MGTEAEKVMSGLSGLAQPINPTNLTPDNLSEYQKSLQDAMDSLKKRYEEPNWFNVAAGFLKPQLGGFAASVGSASQALGQNLESQRQSEIPIAAMKAEMGRVGLIQKQKNDADQLLKAQDPNKPIPANVITQLAKLDPDAANAAIKGNEELTRLEQQKQTTVATTGDVLRNQAAIAQNPWLHGINDEISSISKKSPEEAAATVAKLDKARPTSIDPLTWNGLPPEEKLDKINTYAASQAKLGMEEEAKARDQALGARAFTPKLLTIRGLVTGNGPDDPNNLVGVLGQFQGNTLFDLIAREVNKNGLTNGGIGKDLETSLANLKATPAQINNLQVLIKELASLQADQRDVANNPTNLYQTLRKEGSPTITNTGNAIVRMMDMLALGSRHDQDAFGARIDSGIDARHMDTPTGDLAKMATAYAKARKELAKQDPINEVPSFYTTPMFGTGKSTAPAAETTAPAKRVPTQADRDYVAKNPGMRAKFIATFGVEP